MLKHLQKDLLLDLAALGGTAFAAWISPVDQKYRKKNPALYAQVAKAEALISNAYGNGSANDEALQLAQRNVELNGLDASRAEWQDKDVFEALRKLRDQNRKFDLIVSNPPYVAGHDAHLAQGDLRFEPQSALTDGSADGLASIRAIVGGAPTHLKPGGWLLFEHGYDQADACRELLRDAGFNNLFSARDLAGIRRVAGGQIG